MDTMDLRDTFCTFCTTYCTHKVTSKHCDYQLSYNNKVCILQMNSLAYLMYFIMIYFPSFSLIHSMYDPRMQQSAALACLIKMSTETSWQFVVQITALTSGAIEKDDFTVDYKTSTGKSIETWIPSCK